MIHSDNHLQIWFVSSKTLKQYSVIYDSYRILGYLRSSPCGPAEHCAGGSLPKSCNSCNTKLDYLQPRWKSKYENIKHIITHNMIGNRFAQFELVQHFENH